MRTARARSALGFEPSYSMHPLIAKVTCTGWLAACREEDFSIDAGRAASLIRDARPAVVFLTSPNNPTRTSLPLGRASTGARVWRGPFELRCRWTPRPPVCGSSTRSATRKSATTNGNRRQTQTAASPK